MAVLGYSSVGAASEQGLAGLALHCKYTSGGSGDLTHIRVACWNASAGTHIKLAIYADSGGVPSGTPLFSSAAVDVARTAAPTQESEWVSIAVTGVTVVNGTDYWLTMGIDSGGSYCAEETSGGTRRGSATSYANFPLDPAGTTSALDSTKMSIYCDISAASPSSSSLCLLGCG